MVSFVDEIDDKGKDNHGELSPVKESPRPSVGSPALESPGVTRSRTLPSSKGNKDASSELQQQQQRARVLRKQKRASSQQPKTTSP